MENKKIKLLRIAYNDLGHGGIQSQFMNVTRLLSDKVDSDIIIWSSKPGYYYEEFKKYGKVFMCPCYEGKSKVLKVLDFYFRYPKLKRFVKKVIKENGPYDAVHCHKFFECAPCLAAAYKCNVPVRIAQSHNTEPVNRKSGIKNSIRKFYYGICRKKIHKYATHMIGCSQAAADYVFGNGVGRPLYNGVDLDKFNIDNYPAVSNDGVRLIHIGRYSIQKNQLFILDVLKKLNDKGIKASLTLIGDGKDYYFKVKKKAKELNLESLISFLPHNSDVPAELSKSDYFIFPSTYEGFGNVLLEAQAMGLKCFVSSEIIKEINCGHLSYLELKKGADYWAEKIADYYNEFGTKKVKSDVSRFSSRRMADELYGIYKGEIKS